MMRTSSSLQMKRRQSRSARRCSPSLCRLHRWRLRCGALRIGLGNGSTGCWQRCAAMAARASTPDAVDASLLACMCDLHAHETAEAGSAVWPWMHLLGCFREGWRRNSCLAPHEWARAEAAVGDPMHGRALLWSIRPPCPRSAAHPPRSSARLRTRDGVSQTGDELQEMRTETKQAKTLTGPGLLCA
mmetsp:Transcript_9011/g.23559  ORF Transcript_9011/g.23559 Transcript_9011/m.23559 type:complete len:187 (+) Transcript_9011:796-1356(+)